MQKTNTDTSVKASSTLKLLWFSARWCGPCQQMVPTFNAVNELYGDRINIEKIDVDDNPELAVNHQIRGVPSLVIVNDNGELSRQVGAKPLQTLDHWLDGILKQPGG